MSAFAPRPAGAVDGHSPGESPSAERITVVVATRNRRNHALGTVRRLRQLPERPSVIAVDDGSTDGTSTAVRDAFPDVPVLRTAGHRGVAAARNAGVRAAATPYIAFCDDDSWWAPGALALAVQRFDEHPRLGLLAARILVGAEQRLDQTCAAMADSPLPADGLPGPRILGFVACGTVVRRAAFLEAGGFPEEYVIVGEEEPLALALAAAGWDLAYVDDVVAHHAPQRVSRDPRARHRNQTRNDLWTAWRCRRGSGAVLQTIDIIRGATSPAKLMGVAQALTKLPSVVAQRRPVPPHIEAQRRRLAAVATPADADDPPPRQRRHATAAWTAAAGRRRAARVSAGVVDHHRPEGHDAGEDRVAVVVVTHNRVDELVANLHRLAELPERPHVVVVDNASDDGTAATVRDQHPWVELLVLDRNAGAVGRNVAVDPLPHPYIAFADDDTWWAPGSLRLAADILDAHPDIAVVTARIVVEPGGVEDPVVADMRWSPLTDDGRLPGHPLLSFLAGASIVRRTAFMHAGGFEPLQRIGGEEELLAADLVAAGWRLRYIPELTVHHAPSSSRDAHRRRADGLRNTLWCTWLRRPLVRAAWRSLALLRRAPRDRITGRAVMEALQGLPWVVRERHLLPADVERQFRLLDHQQLNSAARRYIS
jgi:GT2 family glycosyltransferase